MDELFDTENSEVEEIEKEEQAASIETPFNPNLIKIRRDPFTLGQLIDKIEHNEVNFNTAFQRKSNLWDDTKQSRLIESILLNLPLPSFYFDETDSVSQKWNVIDGLQRCSVLNNYVIKKTLKLENLEFLHQYEVKYSELPRELQRRIQQTSITIYVVEQGTPEEVKFNIFKRINTGGLVLTPQEIRHAMNQGIPAQFVEQLANSKLFKKATCNKIKSDRMEDRDFVTRFVSFYLLDYKKYQPDLDGFMTKGMCKIKELTEENREQIRVAFDKAMKAAIDIFGEDAFRKRENITDRRRPINKPLFEVLSVVFSKLTDEQRCNLVNKKESFKYKFMKLNKDEGFKYAISSGTGQKGSVNERFADIERIVNETLNNI